ncbi:MAG: manganese efflux pump MntP family protein [Paraclostridium sp.]
MSLTFILLTSFALSMDAFAVSLSKSMNLKKLDYKTGFKISFLFGLFQGGMPLIGYTLGIGFADYIKSLDHWIALILLCFIGSQMIFDKKEVKSSLITNKDILLLSIATSIDALAVGVSFAFLEISIIPIITAIALITFLVCLIGVFIGSKIGSCLGKIAQLVGGILLILIGFNIFNEHTDFISYFF